MECKEWWKVCFKGLLPPTVASCSLRLSAVACVSLNGNCAGVKWEVTTFPSGHFQLHGAEQLEDGERKEALAAPSLPLSSFSLHFTENLSCFVFAFRAPSYKQDFRCVLKGKKKMKDIHVMKVDSAVTLGGNQWRRQECAFVCFVRMSTRMGFGLADWSKEEQMGPRYQREFATEEWKSESSRPCLLDIYCIVGYIIKSWVIQLSNWIIGAHFVRKMQNFTFPLELDWLQNFWKSECCSKQNVFFCVTEVSVIGGVDTLVDVPSFFLLHWTID